MPKLRCPCGFIHVLSPIPDAGWVTIRDLDYEDLLSAEAKRSRLAGAKEGTLQWDELVQADRAINSWWGSLYACPQCGRIMWKMPGEELYRIYAPEE